MALRLPIGMDIFGELIEKQLDFVDKSLLIQQLLDDVTKVVVITRPRRFGKTLNLSMLHHFFAPQAYMYKTEGMFDNLKIATLGEKYMCHQGKYPVIFITLKDLRDHSFEHTTKKLGYLLAELYNEHRYLLESDQLTVQDKSQFTDILNVTTDQSIQEKALHHLIRYSYQHHKQKVWLLIDEYDTPIQSAYLNEYYDEMINLMRTMLGAALKTNPCLEKAVITGILRVAKKSLFSGLNNVKVYTLLDDQYSDCFGFTESEVTDLFHRAGLDRDANNIRAWYNGYRCGETVIYNPWSIVNCIYEKGKLSPYWVNTSGNDLLRTLFAQSDETLKDKLKQLLAKQPIEALISPHIVFGDLENDQNAVWSLLLFSGYLKAISCEPHKEGMTCMLTIPNHEVHILYEGIIEGWLSKSLGYDKYQNLLKSLLRGDIEEFELRLKNCLDISFSIFDVTGKYPEKFYHGFVLGLMVTLNETYEVQSNKESGFGRYDVMLIPRDKTKLGFVLEFKTLHEKTVNLIQGAEQALQQVIDRRYADTVRAQGIQHILQVGLAFRGKEVKVLAREVDENH